MESRPVEQKLIVLVVIVKYTKSYKCLGVELTSNLTDATHIDAKLSCGRGIFRSLSKVFCSSALSVKLRVKLFQTLIMPTVLHGCECWTLSRAVCYKLNVFKWQDWAKMVIPGGGAKNVILDNIFLECLCMSDVDRITAYFVTEIENMQSNTSDIDVLRKQLTTEKLLKEQVKDGIRN